jgi:hypothetical protein
VIGPFFVSGLSFLTLLGIVVTFKEPQTEEKSGGQAGKPDREVLRQSLAMA